MMLDELKTPEMKINKNQDFNNITEDDIKLYFRCQFTNNYKVEEKELKKIIDKDVQHQNKDKHVKFLIYYKNRKLKTLFIKNKITNFKTTNISENDNVIYIYTCDKSPCNVTHTCYIGLTTTTVKEKIKQHSYIKQHFTETHKEIFGFDDLTKHLYFSTSF